MALSKLYSNELSATQNASDAASLRPAKDEEMTLPQPVFDQNENFLNTEYDIKTKYAIVSDNKPHHVIINSTEIPVTLAYSTVPKLDKDAFLMGKIAHWEDYNLIPGAAKIYFDESYLGQTVLDPSTTKDTLYLNLGRDKSIMIKRNLLKDKCKEQTIGENKVHTKIVEITIRNTKAISLPFEVEDQIPITSDNAIKINLIDSDHATLNEATGKLTWKLNLKPKETQKIQFSYEVKFPKDKIVLGM